jgi:hypothetical protein
MMNVLRFRWVQTVRIVWAVAVLGVMVGISPAIASDDYKGTGTYSGYSLTLSGIGRSDFKLYDQNGNLVLEAKNGVTFANGKNITGNYTATNGDEIEMFRTYTRGPFNTTYTVTIYNKTKGITYTFEQKVASGWLRDRFSQLSPEQLGDPNAVVAAILSSIEQDLDEVLLAADEYKDGTSSPEVFYQCPGFEELMFAAELFYECPGFEEYAVVDETPPPAVAAPVVP